MERNTWNDTQERDNMTAILQAFQIHFLIWHLLFGFKYHWNVFPILQYTIGSDNEMASNRR